MKTNQARLFLKPLYGADMLINCLEDPSEYGKKRAYVQTNINNVPRTKVNKKASHTEQRTSRNSKRNCCCRLHLRGPYAVNWAIFRI